MTTPIDTTRLETALLREARRHAGDRAAQQDRERLSFERIFWLRRLAVPAEEARAAADGNSPDRLAPITRAGLAVRLDAALAGFRRAARRGDPRYDVDRHIALHRLRRWLDPARVEGGARDRPGAGRKARERPADRRSSGARRGAATALEGVRTGRD